MNLDTLKKHVGLVRDVLAVVAICAGGLWAVFQFMSLYQNDIAWLSVQKLKKETDYQPVMAVSVSARAMKNGQSDWLIEATTTVTNSGTLKDTLDLTQQPFSFYQVTFKDSGFPKVAEGMRSNLDFPALKKEVTLLPGESEHFRTLYKTPKPGMYYVEFKVPLSANSRQQWQQAGQPEPGGNLEWSDGVYLEVGG